MTTVMNSVVAAAQISTRVPGGTSLRFPDRKQYRESTNATPGMPACLTVLYSSHRHLHQLPPKDGETPAKGIDVHTGITDHFTFFRTKKLGLPMQHFQLLTQLLAT